MFRFAVRTGHLDEVGFKSWRAVTKARGRIVLGHKAGHLPFESNDPAVTGKHPERFAELDRCVVALHDQRMVDGATGLQHLTFDVDRGQHRPNEASNHHQHRRGQNEPERQAQSITNVDLHVSLLRLGYSSHTSGLRNRIDNLSI
jgi:hypothetical protein